MTSPLLFSNRYIPSEYNVHFNLDGTKPNFKSTVSISLQSNPKFNESSSTSTNFDLTLNTISLISLSAFAVHGDEKKTKLSIKLQKDSNTTVYSSDSPIEENVTSVEITYLGAIETILKYDDLTRGLFKTQYMNPLTGVNDMSIWSTHTQPHFSGKLLPCIDEISLKVPVQLTLTLDPKYETISNTLIESEELNGKLKTVKFKKTPPMSLSVFAFTFGDLEVIEHSKAKIPLRIFTQVGESHRSRFALNSAIQTLNDLTSLFDIDFPLKKLDFIALPFLSDGAVENWGHISVINDGMLTPGWQISKLTLQRVERQIQDIIVHQFVHMFMGDLITIDHWKYEWFNEAFATFMANEVLNRWETLSGDELQQLKLSQMDLEIDVIQNELDSQPDRIHDTFTRGAYEKGIWVLKLVMSLFETPKDFFKAVGQFIQSIKFGVFKPIDLWKFLKTNELNKLKYDIPTLVHSWTHLKGLPIITLSKIENGFKLEQHRCIYEEMDIEDVPYQIPIVIKTLDGRLGRQLMTDRSLIVNESDILFIKSDLSIVNYPVDQYKLIASNFNKLDDVEQCQLIHDLNILLGSQYQSDDHIIGSIELIKNVKNISKLNSWAMNSLLTNFIQLSKSNDKFNKLSNELTNKFVQQFQWENLMDLPQDELNLRATILSLNLDNNQLQQLAKKMFKKLMHGPRNSTPKEFLVPLFSLIAHGSTIKEFKDITHIIKNPDTVINNTFTESSVSQLASKGDIQLSAINSLGNTQDPQLISKVFNFISSNVEFPMIEMALMGMTCYEDIWSWWLKHELQWWSKWNANHLSTIGRFFENVTKYLFDLSQRVGGEFQTNVENWVFQKTTKDDKRIQYWLLESKEKPQEVTLDINENVLSYL